MTAGAHAATTVREVASGPRHRSAVRVWVEQRPLVVAGVFAVLGLAVRAIGLSRSFELWVDEMLYADLGASVSRGQLPNLPDGHFFLHPPGFFVIEGAVIKALNLPTSDSMNLVYDLRWVNAILGALSVALAYLLVSRLAGTAGACLTAVLLVFDPFVLRNNSRVFLETPAGVFALAGLLVLVSWVQRERIPGQRFRGSLLSLAGLLMGCAVLTKDAFLFGTGVPVLLAVLWRRTLALRHGITVLLAMAVPYGSYLILLVVTGYFADWERAKSQGLLRLIGHTQTTGFNAPNAPSLLGRLLAELENYGTSYVLLLVCLPAGLFVSFSARRDRRLIGLMAVAMGLFGLYLALFGTFEEQYGYGIMVASATVLGVVGAELAERHPRWRISVVRAGVLLVVLTLVLGTRLELVRDNGFQTFRAWAASHLPADARVGVTNDTGEWVFRDDPRFGLWTSAKDLQEHQAHYVLTLSLPTVQGYTSLSPAMLQWLSRNAVQVFAQSGPTNGDTVLWYLDQRTLDRAVRLGVGSESSGGKR